MDAQDRQLRRTRDVVLGGDAAAAPRTSHPRPEIAASWRRLRAKGLDPGSDPSVPPLDIAEIEQRRAQSRLHDWLPLLAGSLRPMLDAGQLLVIADRDGRVLWRQGNSGVRRLADRLGFIGGSAWTEGNVGTNAIGTSLVLGDAVQIHGGEHYVESHTRWGCAAAPLTDPWTGDTLGVVDVSGPSQSMHPAELALVQLSARLSAMEMRERHRTRLDRLRAETAYLLDKVAGRALIVDLSGHVAAASGMSAPERVGLPSEFGPGTTWLAGLGTTLAEPLPGGWLLRLPGAQDDTVPTSMVLDLTAEPCVEVESSTGRWRHTLSQRHAEIVLALVRAGSTGRTAAELSTDLFADDTRLVTVRAEVSRLRRTLGSLLLARPYRLNPTVAATVLLPQDRGSLMPGSGAPVVMAARSES